MSEERKLILQMVAEGKVSVAEGELLLQAVDESERAIRTAGPGQTPQAAPRPAERKLDEQPTDQLPVNAVRLPAQRSRMIKAGISIDRETVQQQEELMIPTRAGDRLVLENRIGDVTVRFTDDPEIAMEVRKTVWGADRADAEERAKLTKLAVTRRGADLVVETSHPDISAVGVIILKDTRLDYIIRAPHGTNLQVRNKVGDMQVEAGDQLGTWDLETKVGDVDLRVGAGAGFRHHLDTRVGKVYARLDETEPGQVGDGTGSIHVSVKTGDIRLQH